MQIGTIKLYLPKKNLVKSEHFKHLKYRPNPEFRLAWDEQFEVWKAIVYYNDETIWKWIHTKKMKFTTHMVYFRHFRHDIFHCVLQSYQTHGAEVKLLSHIKTLCSFPNFLHPQHKDHWLRKVKTEGRADEVEWYLTHETAKWSPVQNLMGCHAFPV